MTGPNAPQAIEDNDNLPSFDRENSLVKKYVASKLNKKSDRLAFTKSLKGQKKVPESIISEIGAFKTQSWNERFRDLEITSDSVSIEEIQRWISWFLAEIYSKKVTLRTTFLEEYDISSTEYDKKISSGIEDIDSEEKLDVLQSSDVARDEFLAEIYKKQVPKRRLVVNALQDFNLEERYDKLEPHLKDEFIDTVQKFQRRQKLEISDIMSLFESNILTVAEKQQIIETFMPSMSLSDAKTLWIIDQKTWDKLKKDALEKALWISIFGWANLESYINDVDDSNLLISTKWVFASAQSQEQLFEQNLFFKKFEESFDWLLKKIEEDLAKNSIQTVEETQKILSGVSHISGIENFKEGSTMIIKQSQKNASWEMQTVTFYAEIVSIASAGTFIIKEKWVDTYDLGLTKSSRQTYSDFIDFTTKGDNIPDSVEFISPNSLKHRLQTGEIPDINGNGLFLEKSEVSEDISELRKKIEERENFLRKKKLNKQERENDPELQKLKREKDEKNDLLWRLDEDNVKTLTEQVDEIDSEWKKFGLEKWVNFVTQDGKWDVFSITDIDEGNQIITVRWLQNNEPISYVDFIEQFKLQKATRVSKIDHFEELFSKWDGMKGFKFEDKKVKKEGAKLEVDYNYLVPPAGSDAELLKIHDINDTMVTVSFWKVEDIKKLDKKQWKEVKEWEIFKAEKQEYTVSIWVLDHYIRQNKLSFRSLKEWKVREEEMEWIPKPEQKFGFANWFFQGMSIDSVLKWGKIGIEQITNMMNEWDEDKANQFALKVFGSVIGQDGRTDLRSRVEQTQKKNMDEMIERLKGINSAPATKLILSWLKDPRTPHYKQEAGLFFMMEKYGVLCCKELYHLQGTYFWYQQLGGRVWDEVWVEVHKSNEATNQNTTEEELVYRLMKKQTRAEWFNGVKRRSKLDKELKAMRWDGKTGEWETWVKDGSDERDIEDRLTWGLAEMSSWNYPNAMWWLETITDKWWSMYQMNMIPFVMSFSGMAYRFEKNLLDKLKNFTANSRMLMMTRLMSYSWDLDLLNKTILEVSKNLEKQWGKYTGIAKKAQDIFDERKSNTVKDKTKQDNAIKFYEEYWEELNKILYMLNTGDKDDVNNKMIFFEKDNPNNESSSVFTDYYNKVNTLINQDGSFTKEIWLMQDSFEAKWTSWLDMYKASEMYNMLNGWVLKYKEWAQPMWKKEMVRTFKSNAVKKFSDDPVENERKRKYLIESDLRKFLSKIMSMHQDARTLWFFNSPTWYFTELNKWGVYFEDIVEANLSSDDVKKVGGKKLIDRFVKQLIDHETKWIDYSKHAVRTDSWGYSFVERGSEQDVNSNAVTVSDLIQGKAWDILKEMPKPANQNPTPLSSDDDD